MRFQETGADATRTRPRMYIGARTTAATSTESAQARPPPHPAGTREHTCPGACSKDRIRCIRSANLVLFPNVSSCAHVRRPTESEYIERLVRHSNTTAARSQRASCRPGDRPMNSIQRVSTLMIAATLVWAAAPRSAVAGDHPASRLSVLFTPTHGRYEHGDSDHRGYSHRGHGDSDYADSDAWRGYRGHDRHGYGSYGHHDSHRWPPYYRPYYRPFTSEYALRDALRRLFFALGYHSRGFYCSRCKYHCSRPDSFFDHLRRHHHLSYYDTLSRIRWSPTTLMFVFTIR